MENLKLTIDQLKNYLGTGLEYQTGNYQSNRWLMVVIDVENDRVKGRQDGYQSQIKHPLSVVKPLCYKLSDLDKFIPELGFVPVEELLRISYPKWFEEKKGTRYEEIVVDQSLNYTKSWVKYMATFCIDVWMVDIENEEWWILQKLFQWHFWPFGDEYFEAGLVIDKLKQGKETTHEK